MFAILGRLDLHFQLFLIALVPSSIDDTITKVHQRIEAETESCEDALLLSLMYCESIFSGFTWLRSKQRQEMTNPLLFLSIMGSAMPRRLVQIDTRWHWNLKFQREKKREKKEKKGKEKEGKKEKRRIKVFEDVDFKR